MRADKRLAAVCGLFCPACTVSIGTREDPERLEAIAGRLGRAVEELECHGCRGSKRCFHCESICVMAKCAANKGVDFCGQCPEYPCSDLKTFQAAMPHRRELWRWQERIKEAGYETWFAEMVRHFSCYSSFCRRRSIRWRGKRGRKETWPSGFTRTGSPQPCLLSLLTGERDPGQAGAF